MTEHNSGCPQLCLVLLRGSRRISAPLHVGLKQNRRDMIGLVWPTCFPQTLMLRSTPQYLYKHNSMLPWLSHSCFCARSSWTGRPRVRHCAQHFCLSLTHPLMPQPRSGIDAPAVLKAEDYRINEQSLCPLLVGDLGEGHAISLIMKSGRLLAVKAFVTKLTRPN